MPSLLIFLLIWTVAIPATVIGVLLILAARRERRAPAVTVVTLVAVAQQQPVRARPAQRIAREARAASRRRAFSCDPTGPRRASR